MIGSSLMFITECNQLKLVTLFLSVWNVELECLRGPYSVPCFFTVYERYYKVSKKVKATLFADDPNLLYSHKNLKSLESTVNNELVNLYDWLTVNKLLMLKSLTM